VSELVQKTSPSKQGVHVRVDDLDKTFMMGGRRIEVLRGASIELQAGELAAVLGPSGSGKSTFLQILGTLDRPTSGSVQLDGRDVFSLPTREIDRLRNQRIGFVFQFHHLLPDQSARGNVALPLIIKGTPTAEAFQLASARLERVGLGHRLDHRPPELSGGEQQRVAIARAMVMNPGLLLADEPTGNLDPKTADGVFELLMELNRENGSTMVVVTHSQALAARFPRRFEVVEGLLVEAA
jgi:ABC-type lipoprotein export system ATPase subunit